MKEQLLELTGLAVLVVLLLFMRKKERESRRREQKREEMILDYPDIVSQMILFLGAGMTVRGVLEKMAADYQKKRKETGKRRYIYEEILITCREMERGITEEEAYRRMGNRIQIPRYRTFTTLLVQHLKKGNHQLQEILEREAAQTLEERKRRARIYGEQAVTKMLFPMVFMLLDVLVILLVPAFMNFY
ncbi:MAG: type II secretion system F family protein [Lachnospiraceae bacterium]|jgi:tight adherence protein C